MLIRSSICGTFLLLLQIGIAGALLGLSFPCFAQTQNVTYTVEIKGAGKLSSLLREHLDISRRQNAVLSTDELERLVAITPQQARELLATESYFSAVVQPVLDRGVDLWVVRIAIALGPETRVDALDIHFSGGIVSGPNADQRRMNQLRRRWQLKQGEIFRQTAWNEAKSELLKGLLVRDFPAATIIRSEARIDPQKSSAALTVEVDSGPAFTFGELNIQGLERYSRTMIDSQNPIHPGDPYSQEKLNELQSRLEDSGYFRSAFATVDIDPAQPERVPVRLDLIENPRKRLGLGGGFSTDTGARAQVKWLDRNFLRRNWRLESELRIDRETRVLGGDVFLQPIAIGWLPSFGAHLERTESGGEINDKIRTGARLVSPNKVDEKAWAIAFLADRQRIGDNFSNNRQALIGSFTYTKRRLNNPLRPRRGYVASLELGVGPRGLVNESHIGRVVGRALWMHTFSPRWRTVARGQIGQVFGGSRQTVPADLLFRTGGDQSVRGYGYDSLGVEQNGAVVAGKVSAVLSAELIYQVTPQWGAALFTDAGNAADAWRDFVFKRGSGVGARWNSPIGPINLDLAYGHATREPRLHFSIGYGF
ncbi:MAG TPA: autotransporter assembly complex family protein [Noviherbaspirillum sp.]|nr:autotransporter assembly complex family protein [Noviherbaspirillum sp.]